MDRLGKSDLRVPLALKDILLLFFSQLVVNGRARRECYTPNLELSLPTKITSDVADRVFHYLRITQALMIIQPLFRCTRNSLQIPEADCSSLDLRPILLTHQSL